MSRERKTKALPSRAAEARHHADTYKAVADEIGETLREATDETWRARVAEHRDNLLRLSERALAFADWLDGDADPASDHSRMF